jgi:hypothetical protein
MATFQNLAWRVTAAPASGLTVVQTVLIARIELRQDQQQAFAAIKQPTP